MIQNKHGIVGVLWYHDGVGLGGVGGGGVPVAVGQARVGAAAQEKPHHLTCKEGGRAGGRGGEMRRNAPCRDSGVGEGGEGSSGDDAPKANVAVD